MTTAVRPTAATARIPAVAESVTRADALPSWLDLRFGLPDPAEGWVRCAELLDEPERFDAWRKILGEWLLEEYGDAPERTTAGYVMGWYLSVPALLAALLFHTERRVPSLRPTDLAFLLPTEGRPHPVGVALLADEFACLPDDPAGDCPEATVVGSEAALAALLRARYAAHAARFVAAYAPGVRLGRRMLWAQATDSLDGATWLAGQLHGDEGAGVADAAMLLPERLAPFTSASTLRSARDEDGGARWTRRRESCCFHYAIPGTTACVTCPRVS
ncbi:(2Fe-2S)-binding protein [Solihabitans fulvus]|uniref:(2Fe-2S)-binding protein n=1 Tax=Solihabitans fulvus TaxID=1892852 RepID=A0A5B2XH08_9PSEU|nr:(2Fe-2S)-binding protein [Solihabitans fulvus]KAA2262325.1 (2Fe-2S)-binding protein [Solihabitans fulvus]